MWWVAVFASPDVRWLTLGSLDPVLVAVFDVPLFVIASALAALGLRAAALVATVWTCGVAVALAIYATATTESGWGVLIMSVAAAASVLAVCLVLRGRVPTEWIAAGPFAFRPARPSTPHLRTTLLQLVVFWGFFLVVVAFVLSFLERRWNLDVRFSPAVVVVGVVLLVVASALGIASAVTMATIGRGTPLPSAMPNRLVIAGPYRLVRNPMAVAGIVQGVGVGLVASSWLVVAYAVLGSFLWNYAVRPLEEADLEQRFGTEFRQYCKRVRCWVPRWRKPSTSLES